MWFASKLKAETSINMLLPAIITIAGTSVLWILLGPRVAWVFIAAIFFIYSAFSFSAYVRTRNVGYLIAALFQVSGCLWIGGAKEGFFFISDQVHALSKFCALLFGVWMQVLLLSRRFKWRGREIMELAAQPVEDVTDGFTARPRPIEQTPLSRKDTLDFAQFVSRNLIAMPYVEPNKVVFVPVTMAQSFKHVYPWGPDYHNDTWVSVDDDGQVSVNIARQDYVKYRDSLSFDQLCQSLGGLFIEFMDLFKRGEGVRIIDRLNALRINPYT
jgi:hypothetical protein